MEENNQEVVTGLAEQAFAEGDVARARTLLERFLQLAPQKDQFYCRMKILSGRIIYAENMDKNGVVRINQCRRATAEILEAVEVARLQNNIPRYKFIVFNATVAFWNIAREFVRPGRGQFFASDFSKIVNALEQQDDPDKYWRITMLSAASICADDEKNLKNGCEFMDKAIALLEGMLAVTLGEETQMTTVSDACKAEVDAAMNAFRQIEDREELLRKPRKIDPDLPDDDEYYTKPIEYPPLQGLAAEGFNHVKELLDVAQSKRADIETKLRAVIDRKNGQFAYLVRLYRERIAIAPADSKKILALPQVVKDVQLFCMVQLQSILSNAIPEKEIDATWQHCIKKLQDSPASESRSETLLDFSRAAWLLKQHEIAKRCMDIMQASNPTMSRTLRAKLDICEALLLIHNIDSNTREVVKKQLMSTKQIEGFKSSKRLEAIKLLERTISTTASILEDKFLLYEMCTILWNILIPFLSRRLRLKVQFALRTIANVLDELTADALPLLRSQVHYELSLAEEAADFAGIALTEVQKAYALDFGGIAAANPSDAVSPLDSDLLNMNRLMDQFLTPFLKSMTLRIDVYASPSEAENQAILWLQQAKESSSKPFVRDMITKTTILVIEEIVDRTANTTQLQGEDAGPIDWSLIMMKKGKLSVSELTMTELESIFQPDFSTLKSDFSYSYQRVFQILFNLIRLSFSAQDVNILTHAYFRMMKFKFAVTDSFAYEFIDGQIEASCNFAESMLWKIQQLGKKIPLLLQEVNADPQENGVFAMGVAAVVPDALITKNIDLAEINSCKKMAIQALEYALSLALSRKDAFSTHNVLIFFWNLHLHVFRRNLYPLILEDVFRFLRTAVQSFDVQSLFSFPNIKECCDLRLLCNYIEALSGVYESKKMMAEAVDTVTKGVNLVFPTAASASCTATYFKKSLAETAARLTIQNAIAGVVVNPDPKAKGKNAGAATATEPPVFAENNWLTCFASLTVAEFLFPSDVKNNALNVPKDACLAALEKAVKLFTVEVQAMVQKEQETEASGVLQLRTKENFDQRLELLLETYARLSRMHTIQGDFIGSQNFAETAIALFESEQIRCYGRKVDPTQQVLLNHNDDMKQLIPSRVFRWMAGCELSMALAVMSFLDSAKGVGGVSTLDESLVLELQFSALNHLQPAIAYASWSREEELLQRGTSIVAQILPMLLQSDNSLYFRSSVDIAKSMLYDEMTIVPRNKSTQRMIRGVYLATATGLIGRKCYDEALKVIMHAFDKLDNDLQKDLWPGRVICMSKKGMNVLDGLQKLKESDPVLQAQVLVLFARSSKKLPSKLSGYQQAIELLDQHIERVEYLAELAEVLACSGFARPDIRAMLVEGMSTLCSVEEGLYEEIADWEEGDILPYDIKPLTVAAPSTVGGGGIGDRGSTIRAASVVSKTRKSDAPASSAGARQLKSASVRGSTRGGEGGVGTPSMAGSQARTVNNFKSGTSIARSQVTEGRPLTGIPEDSTMPSRLSFQSLELAARISIMRLNTDINEEEQLEHCLKAFYFMQRAVDTWCAALREVHRCEQYAALDAETRANTPLMNFTCEAYPEYLVGWNLDARLTDILFHWNHDQALRDCTWKQHQRINNLDANKLELPKNLLLDIPSLQSMPVFSASVYHFFTLIDKFLELQLPYHSLYVIKFLRLILWSFPVLTASTDDRNTALVALQLLYQHTLLKLGVHDKQPNAQVQFSCEEFLIAVDGRSVLLGDFVRDTMQKWCAKHIHEDIAEKHKLDVYFRDLLNDSDDDASVHSLSRDEKFNPFQIEVSSVAFESLTKIESDFFWLKTMTLLKDLGQWAIAEPLVVMFMWEKRYKRQPRYFCEAMALHLELLLLKGQALEVVALMLACKPLLQKINCDCLLLHRFWQVLIQGYLLLDQVDEAVASAQLFQHLLDDLSLRQLNKVEGQAVEVVSLLTKTPAANSKSDRNRKSVLTLGSSIVDTSVVPVSRQVSSSSTVITGAKSVSGNNSARPWIQRELGVEYVRVWKNNLVLLVHLTYLRAMRRLQQFNNNNAAGSNKADVLEYYQSFCQLLLQGLEVLKEYVGERSFWCIELSSLRVSYAQTFLLELHRVCSRCLHAEDYEAWLLDNLQLVKEYAVEVVQQQRYWLARLDLPESQCEFVLQSTGSTSFNPETNTLQLLPRTFADENAACVQMIRDQHSLPSIVQRHTAEALVQLAWCDWLLAVARKQQMSSTDFSVDPASITPFNPVERFLQQTESTPVDSSSYFQVHNIPQIVILAEQALRYTQGHYPSRAVLAKVLQLTAQLAQRVAAKEFDVNWQTFPAPEHGHATGPEHPSSEAVFIQQELMSLVSTHLDTEDGFLQQLLSHALQVLVESYGTNSQSFQAATVLFMAQSLQAKQWLGQSWASVLSRTSDVHVALQRLGHFHQASLLQPRTSSTSTIAASASPASTACDYVNTESHSVTMVEKKFISHFAPSYRRLSIAQDVRQILTALEYVQKNTLHVVLQTCPLMQTVYLLVGFFGSKQEFEAALLATSNGANPAANAKDSKTKAPSGAAAAGSESAKKPDESLWVVEKRVLSESQRRQLQVLLEQFATWEADAQKFIAIYGESLQEQDDLEPLPNTISMGSNRSTAQKAERALDETFRALAADLNTIFQPLFHPETSAAARFIQKIPFTEQTSWAVQSYLDVRLQQLPWETLNLWEQQTQASTQGKFIRDFSLHMLGQRLQTLLAQLNPSLTVSTLATTAPGTAPPAGVIDAASGQFAGCSVSASSMRYFIDPYEEDRGNKANHRTGLRESFAQWLTASPSPGNGMGLQKWQPLLRNNRALVSLEDFLLQVDASGLVSSTLASSAVAPAGGKGAPATATGGSGGVVSVLGCCLGRLGSLLAPMDMAMMNLERVRLWMTIDRMHNEASFRRQNSSDVLKSTREVEVEQASVLTTALLSLAGVPSLAMTQWSVPISTQQRVLQRMCREWTNPAAATTVGGAGTKASMAATQKVKLAGVFASHHASAAGNAGANALSTVTTTAAAGGGQTAVTSTQKLKRWVAAAHVVYGVSPMLHSE